MGGGSDVGAAGGSRRATRYSRSEPAPAIRPPSWPKLARRVYSLERVASLASQAIAEASRARSATTSRSSPSTDRWAGATVAPFDRILVTAGAPKAPPPLLEQLTVGGRMVVPEGDRESQRLVVYRKLRQGARREECEVVSFVPLTGRHGWDATGAPNESPN